MKKLIEYAVNREGVILQLLAKPRRSYTTGTFHQLRVEIKKMDALFEMINYCVKDFKRKKTFKPLKEIFRQAGKVREIQVEEAMLKKYFLHDLLKDYRENIRQSRLEEQEKYFSLVNEDQLKKLSKSFIKITPILAEINKKEVSSFLKKGRKKALKLLRKKELEVNQLHLLRTNLKQYHYNLNSVETDTTGKLLSMKDVLPDLLGKWHDCQITIGNLEKEINIGGMKTDEIIQLHEVKAKAEANSEILFEKIIAAIPATIAILHPDLPEPAPKPLKAKKEKKKKPKKSQEKMHVL